MHFVRSRCHRVILFLLSEADVRNRAIRHSRHTACEPTIGMSGPRRQDSWPNGPRTRV